LIAKHLIRLPFLLVLKRNNRMRRFIP